MTFEDLLVVIASTPVLAAAIRLIDWKGGGRRPLRARDEARSLALAWPPGLGSVYGSSGPSAMPLNISTGSGEGSARDRVGSGSTSMQVMEWCFRHDGQHAVQNGRPH